MSYQVIAENPASNNEVPVGQTTSVNQIEQPKTEYPLPANGSGNMLASCNKKNKPSKLKKFFNLGFDRSKNISHKNSYDGSEGLRRSMGEEIFEEDIIQKHLPNCSKVPVDSQNSKVLQPVSNESCKVETSTHHNTGLCPEEGALKTHVNLDIVSSSRALRSSKTKSMEKIVKKPVSEGEFSLQKKAFGKQSINQPAEKDGTHFIELDSVRVKTRVLSRAKPELTPEEDERAGRRTEGHPIPRNLTELLNEIDSEEEKMGGDSDLDKANDDEEEFDFDKESKKCQDQLNQIKDAYLVDLPEINPDEALSPPKEEDKREHEKEQSSSLKKVLYFSSLAATTGFYFLMRKHQIL
jgi:hypothetical protein